MRAELAQAADVPKAGAAQAAGLAAPVAARSQAQQRHCRHHGYQEELQDDTSMPLDAAGSSYSYQQSAEEDVLLDHLVIANGQLRSVLQAAGLSSGSPLPHQQCLQEDEQVAVLAEENYQLRQQLQQLQLQQQLAHLQQQQQTAADAQGDPLELERFSDARSPAAASSVGTTGADGCSSRGSRAAGAAAAFAGGDFAGYPPITPRSPAVLGLMGPPSLSAVQLAEAEAAAQLATQAAIQAEAAACVNMAWQYSSGIDSQLGSCSSGYAHEHHSMDTAGAGISDHWGSQGQQQQGAADHLNGTAAAPLTAAAVAALAAASGRPAAAGPSLQDSSSSGLGLLQLPKLLLPRRALRRSMESTRSSRGGPGSDAGSESARSNVTSLTNRSAAAPWSARSTGLGGASVRSVASSVSGGLKQLANDLLLMPAALRTAKGGGGAAAAGATFGSAAAADVLVPGSSISSMRAADVDCDAAASIACSAAGSLWFPRGNGAAAAASSSSSRPPVAAAATQGRAVSPSSKAAALAAEAVQGLQYPNAVPAVSPVQQQQQQGVAAQETSLLGAGELRLKAIRIGPAAQLPPQHPAMAPQGGLPALPRLRVLTTHGSTAASQAAVSSRRSADAAAASTAAAACRSAVDDSPCSSACSDSGFFRAADELAFGNPADSGTAAAAAAAAAVANAANVAAVAAGVELCHLESYADSEVGLLGGRVSSEYVEHFDNSRMSSDLFGARISMDGSGSLLPRVSFSGGMGGSCQQQQQQQLRLSRLDSWGTAGAYDDGCAGASERSEWLGISYQRSKLAGKDVRSLFDQAGSASEAAGCSSQQACRCR